MVASILLLLLALAAVAGIVNAWRPGRSWWNIGPSFVAGWVTIELAPHLILLSGVVAVVLVLAGALSSPLGIAALVLLAVADAVAVTLTWQATRTRISTRTVLAELEPGDDAPRYPRAHIVLPPLMFRRRGLRFTPGERMDVYEPREPDGPPRPAVIWLHGGAWVLGFRRFQGIPLLSHLAANGFVGFSAAYPLSPFATWPEQLEAIHRTVDHVRENAARWNVDPGFIALTGGSAGGHLAAIAALDRSDAVQAAVPFYGVYDLLDEERRHSPLLHSWILEPLVFKTRRASNPEPFRHASPLHRVHEDAPPFFVIHGTRDCLVPVADARRFVERLRDVSRAPVLYAEMRGGQHAFDLIPSLRTVPVIEAVERFLRTLYAGGGAGPRELERTMAGEVT